MLLLDEKTENISEFRESLNLTLFFLNAVRNHQTMDDLEIINLKEQILLVLQQMAMRSEKVYY